MDSQVWNDAVFEYEDILQDDPVAEERIESILNRFALSDQQPKNSFTPDADDAQAAFIHSNATTIRLLAPAGSGKTQSIANRVAKRAAEGTRPERILLLTFDNAARNILAARIDALLASIGLNSKPAVLTLNSFGNSLLRDELRDVVPQLSLGSELPRHQNQIVRASLKQLRRNPELGLLFPKNLAAGVYVQIFSVLKNEILTPDSLATQEGITRYVDLVRNTLAFRPWLDPVAGLPDARPKTKQILNALAALFKNYWAQMRRDNRMDFDDQKLIPYLHLIGDPQLSSMIQSRYETVIVDEFQDINRLDFELIQLVSRKASLVVVGDDDQAIYGFRGCSPRFIIDFDSLSGRDAPRTFILQTNYRSPSNVVEISQKLIAHNSYRVAKKSETPPLAPVADLELWHSVNSASEAQIIAKSVRRIVDAGQGRVQFGDIAVLFRMNSQSLPLQLALIMNEVPYYCRKEDNMLLSDAMERILRLIGLHLQLQKGIGYTNAEDGQALYESFFKYHWQANRQRFVQLAAKEGSFVRAAVNLEAKDPKWRGFAAGIGGLALERSPIGAVEYVGETFRNLRGLIGDLEQAIDGSVPLGELLDVARRFKGTTHEFFETLRRLAQKAEQGLFATGEEDGVNLLTYFRAKGRQWHTVFLPGVNQRVIPERRSPIEDERRLFYVAVTRPTANLVLSYVRQAVREKVVPSQFLSEMGLGEGRERRATQ
jgi:DNA helicase-2/ATP-dependent DNA helicase PcrA